MSSRRPASTAARLVCARLLRMACRIRWSSISILVLIFVPVSMCKDPISLCMSQRRTAEICSASSSVRRLSSSANSRSVSVISTARSSRLSRGARTRGNPRVQLAGINLVHQPANQVSHGGCGLELGQGVEIRRGSLASFRGQRQDEIFCGCCKRFRYRVYVCTPFGVWEMQEFVG